MKNESAINSLSTIPSIKDIAGAVFTHLIFAALGFLTTRGQLLGVLVPFGLSFTGGVLSPYILSAAAGSALGYLLAPTELSFFRYLISVSGIAAIRLLANGTFKGASKPFFSALSVAAVTLATGLVAVRNETGEIILAIAETLIAAGGAYFINRALRIFCRDTVGISGEESGALLISVCILLSGFLGITMADVSFGRIIAFAVSLVIARFAGVVPSSVFGIGFALISLLSSANSSAAVMMAFSALISGVFSSLGKYAVLLSFAVSVFSCSAVIEGESTVIYLIETTVAAVIYILVPKTAGVKIGKLLAPVPIVEPPEGLKKSVTMRLGFAANALTDVSDTVEQVASELSRINAPDFSDVFDGVEETACRGCTLRMHCWESKRNDTVSAVIDMTKAVKRGDTNISVSAPDEFRGRCVRLDAVGDAVSRHYTAYAARIAAESRIDEVRSVISDQFCGISNLLSDLVAEIEAGEVFDNNTASNILSALKSIDVVADGCCCKIDKYGRMSVEIRIKNTKDMIINRMQIMRQASLAASRDFDAPCVSSFGEETIINIIERCTLKADIGVNQIISAPHTLCGDAYRYFPDGKGRFIMVLSDGMGTGGRAAVDSAMAAGLIGRLIKAGFGYDCSLSILNSSMIFKSTDESTATVDIAAIDLYTGRCDLLKAGAAPTLVRRSGRTGKAQSTSLPAGILRDISFDKATIRLRPGDILLLMSDGATQEGTEWICAELENWGNGSAQELSEHISQSAKRRRQDNHEDDITVMAAIIEKADC